MSGLIIGHNLGAMSALSALNSNSNALNNALQQLSTGKRINSAADDASGYAISQKMEAQIKGLNQASQNAQDGISMIQTASGALNQTLSILQTMRQLAVEASNSTTTQSDRQDLQAEFNQLADQINNIAATTQYNTQNLLDGSSSLTASVTSQGKVLQNASVSGVFGLAAGTYTVTVNHQTATSISSTPLNGNGSETVTLSGTYSGTSNIAAGDLQFYYDGTNWNVSTDGGNNWSALSGTPSGNTYTATFDGLTFSVSWSSSNPPQKGDTFTYNSAINAQGDFATLSDGSGATTSNPGTAVAISSNGGAVVLEDGSGNGVLFNPGSYSWGTSSSDTITFAVSPAPSISLQIGPNTGQVIDVTIANMSAAALGITGVANSKDAATGAAYGGTNDVNNGTSGNPDEAALDITSVSNADKAIQTIDNAIQTVTTWQANLGAVQNRLQSTISNLDTSAQNLTSAESGITDADMASEMAQFTQNSVLQQAAVAMLAQANQQPQLVLKLLG
ncbi:flagellin [Alicyclobacillus fructus]|uniref:flagellin N-terminal helical domain-containing protein n=1 Tax=Alicyclobacillus fructus TaxID=2816082 RepID=UPI001A9085B1|nr:flagellin [Alicyclobacillus fructus]